MRRFIGSFVVVLATLFLGTAVLATPANTTPNPAPPVVAPLPGGTDASAGNCVDVSKLDNVKVRDQFFALAVTLFESEPCAVGKPRVVVLESTHPDGYHRVVIGVDSADRTIHATSDDGMVAGMLVHVATLRQDMDGCERAKRLAKDAPTDGARLVIARCSKVEAAAFAEKFWKTLEDMGKTEAAAILAEHLGLTDEAARLRDRVATANTEDSVFDKTEGGAFGFLRINSRPDSNVWIDGRDTGLATPIVKHRVAAGRHQVELKNPQRKCAGVYDVVVQPGQTTPLIKQLDCVQQ